jgi:hypothetical protein
MTEDVDLESLVHLEQKSALLTVFSRLAHAPTDSLILVTKKDSQKAPSSGHGRARHSGHRLDMNSGTSWGSTSALHQRGRPS